MRRVCAILLIVLVVSALESGGKTWASPLTQSHENGSVEALWQYVSTGGAAYYHLVYWSDNLKVTGFYAEPNGDGPYPAVIYNRGGARENGALDGTELAAFAESG